MGTKNYMANEFDSRKKSARDYFKSIDVYSYGVLLLYNIKYLHTTNFKINIGFLKIVN